MAAVCLVFLWACSSAPETSRFEPGDYVVYKYSGTYRPAPVILTKKILSKQGNKLEILVEWKSGAEKRAWKEYITDTPYSRANSIVDRLVTLGGGKETELANAENIDLFKLYDGTYVMPQHVPSPESQSEKTVQIGREKFLCRERVYRSKAEKVHVRMTLTDSPDFKWEKVSASWVASRGGVPVYAFEILDYGNSNKPGPRGK